MIIHMCSKHLFLIITQNLQKVNGFLQFFHRTIQREVLKFRNMALFRGSCVLCVFWEKEKS